MTSHLTCQGCGADFYERGHLRDDRPTLCAKCMAFPTRPCHVCGLPFGPEGDDDLGLCMSCSDGVDQRGAQ